MKHIRIHLAALSAVALLVLAFGATNASAQEAGTRGVYGRSTERKSPSSGVTYGAENKDLVPVQFITERGVLSFFSTTTVFGTPLDITLSELALESFFPADAATAETLRALAAFGPP